MTHTHSRTGRALNQLGVVCDATDTLDALYFYSRAYVGVWRALWRTGPSY